MANTNIDNLNWSNRPIIDIGKDLPYSTTGIVDTSGGFVEFSGSGSVTYKKEYQPGPEETIKLKTDALKLYIGTVSMEPLSSRYSNDYSIDINIQYYREEQQEGTDEIVYSDGVVDNIVVYPYYYNEEEYEPEIVVPTRNSYIKSLNVMISFKADSIITVADFIIEGTVGLEEAIVETLEDSGYTPGGGSGGGSSGATEISIINEYDNGFEVWYSDEERPATIKITQTGVDKYNINISDIHDIEYNVKNGGLPY